MSEKRTNSIGLRLSNHFDGKSKKLGIINYNNTNQLFFTYLNFEMLKKIWKLSIENLESYIFHSNT